MPYIGRSTDGFGVRNRFLYLASASDTSVSGADVNGAILSFSDGAYVDVYLNGVLLKAGTDYNTNTANTIAGLSAMAANDEVTVIVYDIFAVADTVSQSSGGTFSGAITFDSTVSGLDVNGTEIILDADGDTTITADTDDTIDIKIGGSDIFQMTASKLDINGKELILDADADTSITADTDDQIDIKVAGSDLAHITSTYAKLRGATPLVFGENNSTGTFQSISGEVGANNLLLRSYQSLTFKNGTSGSSLTDGTTAFNIDANGIVTMPLQPAFMATSNSNNNHVFSSADSYEQIITNVETIDKNSDYASSTFTAPVDGTYFISGAVMHNASSSGVVAYDLAVYVNSAVTLYARDANDNYTLTKMHAVNGLVDLDASDTVKLYARVSDVKSRMYFSTTTLKFQGYLVA